MFLSLLLILTMTAGATEPAKFTVLEYNKPAPFAGVLFDEYAMSQIMADFDIYKYSCDIQTDYQLKIQKEEYEYKLENLKIEHFENSNSIFYAISKCLTLKLILKLAKSFTHPQQSRYYNE